MCKSILCFVFQVCCRGGQCANDFGENVWVPATISNKNALKITLAISSSYVGQQLYSIRYLWREISCPFKQAATYSGANPNLHSPLYRKTF
jgi:hypothetical protein